MTQPPATSVAIVEDDPTLGSSLKRIVDSMPGCRCAGVWRTAEEALVKVPAFGPEVVLMDINLPGMSGIEATARLKQQMPALLVIMITVYRDHGKIFQALKAGACGYLLKRATPDEIRAAIKEVLAGGAPMSAEIARLVVEAFHSPTAVSSDDAPPLTKRETEILEWLCRGLPNKLIAEELGLSIETVRVHLKRIYEKLHVHSRTEAAMKFRDSGRGAPYPG